MNNFDILNESSNKKKGKDAVNYAIVIASHIIKLTNTNDYSTTQMNNRNEWSRSIGDALVSANKLLETKTARNEYKTTNLNDIYKKAVEVADYEMKHPKDPEQETIDLKLSTEIPNNFPDVEDLINPESVIQYIKGNVVKREVKNDSENIIRKKCIKIN